MKCRAIGKQKPDRVCLGDLNRKVLLQTSFSFASNNPEGYAEAGFETIETMWARVDTSSGVRYVNDVAVAVASTTIYARFNPSLNYNQKLYAVIDGIRYRVDSAEDLNKNKEFVKMVCIERGAEALEAAKR